MGGIGQKDLQDRRAHAADRGGERAAVERLWQP